MQLDLVDLRNRYAKLETRELLRLSEGDGFVPEVQKLIDDELAHRRDRGVVVASERAVEVAASGIVQGTRPADLQQALIRDGLAPGAAADAVRTAEAAVAYAKKRAVTGRIVGGAALLGLGMAVTAFTHAGAENSGGYYIVAWGAVLSGAVQCVRGVWALVTKSRDKRSGRAE